MPQLECCRGTNPSQAANCRSILEALSIADGGYQGTGRERADARNRGQFTARCILPVPQLNLRIYRLEPILHPDMAWQAKPLAGLRRVEEFWKGRGGRSRHAAEAPVPFLRERSAEVAEQPIGSARKPEAGGGCRELFTIPVDNPVQGRSTGAPRALFCLAGGCADYILVRFNRLIINAFAARLEFTPR